MIDLKIKPCIISLCNYETIYYVKKSLEDVTREYWHEFFLAHVGSKSKYMLYIDKYIEDKNVFFAALNFIKEFHRNFSRKPDLNQLYIYNEIEKCLELNDFKSLKKILVLI